MDMAYTLVELHSVVVAPEEINGASNQIYGEIKALDPEGCPIYFYKEEKESSKSISMDGTLPLVGPRCCIIGPDFAIAVSLKEKSRDLEVSDGYIAMSRCPHADLFDKPVRFAIPGDYGYAMLHFSMFHNAVQATINASLITNGNIGKRPHINHGKIVALYEEKEDEDAFARKYNQTFLFSVPQDEPIELQQVAQGEEQKFLIPLSRFAVAVPSNLSLFIKADLGINFPETSSQIVSVGDTLSFTADFDDNETRTKSICFECGRIEVSVTWLEKVKRKVFMERIKDDNVVYTITK